MKKTQKLTAALLACLMALIVAGCSGKDDSSSVPPSSVPSSSTPSSTSEPDSQSGPDSVPAATADGDATFQNLSFQVPEGFEFVETTIPMYMAADGSNINITNGPKDVLFASYTKDLFEDLILAQLLEMDENAEYEITLFEHGETGGVPSIRIESTSLLQGTTLTQVQIVLDAEETYTVTYSDMSGSRAWQSAFADSIATINIAG